MSAIPDENILEVDFGTLGIVVAGADLPESDDVQATASRRASFPVDPLPLSSGVGQMVVTAAPFVSADLLALAISGGAAIAISHLLGIAHGGVAFNRMIPLMFFPFVLTYWAAGLYPGICLHPVVELQQLIKLMSVVFVALIGASFITNSLGAWRVLFIVAWPLSLVLVPVCRAFVRRVCASRSWWGYPAVVISSGEPARTVVNMLLQNPQTGLRPMGVVDPVTCRRGSIGGVPMLGSPANAASFVRSKSVMYAVIALPELGRRQVTEIIDLYEGCVPHLLILSNLSDLPTLWRDTRNCGGLPGTALSNGLVRTVPRLAKRTVDVVLTLVGGITLLPMFLFLVLLVRLTSRGPIFYGQRRIGEAGRNFRAWKFRTMRPDADQVLQSYLAENPAAREEWEKDHKLRNDPRVTNIGNFLRKSSLDELPQLWNVLKGEMSLVGPRPIVDAEIQKYGEIFSQYKRVKPGITGLWQVSGRNDTTYSERVQLDCYYVRNWSPWLDMHILARTFAVLIVRQGAY